MRPVIAIATALLIVLGWVADTEGKRLRKRTRDRQVPTGWCAMDQQDLLRFTADGRAAKIRITASDFLDGIGVDNVFVASVPTWSANQVDTVCTRAYDFTASRPGEAYFELFDLEANGWLGSNAFLVADSAPRLPFDDPLESEGAGGSALLGPGGFIETEFRTLVPGQDYYLGAWWSWEGGDGANLLLEVDTLDPAALYLNGGRFRVTSTWLTDSGGGSGTAVPLTDDTGWFWFFRSTNVEVVIKVLNGCPVNNRYWVFASGLTNVEVDLEILDLQSGQTYTITNPRGRNFPPRFDTNAFSSCP